MNVNDLPVYHPRNKERELTDLILYIRELQFRSSYRPEFDIVNGTFQGLVLCVENIDQIKKALQ